MFHGSGPWPCYFCGKSIRRNELYTEGRKQDPHVHHVDEDKANNEPENLALAHVGCHSTHHAKTCGPGCTCGRHKTPSAKESQRRSEGLKRAYREGRR